MKATFTSTFGAEGSELQHMKNPSIYPRIIIKEAIALDMLTMEIWEKLPHSDCRHKIQLLTLSPESSSINPMPPEICCVH